MHVKGKRTIAVNVLGTIVPFMALAEWHDIIPAKWWPLYALGLALVNTYLRTVTTTPVFRKE